MYRSKDGKVTVDVVKTLADAVLPAADFSLFNLPLDADTAQGLFDRLANIPIHKHTCLMFVRHSRLTKLQALANLQKSKLTYLDTVHLWYEKPNSSSNIGFLPMAEEALIFYKGEIPNPKNTSWFSGDVHPNATNMWGISPAESEGRSFTHYKQFAWEIGLLLHTMTHPCLLNKMIYALEDDHLHVLKFCRHYNLSVHFVVKSDEDAKKIIARSDLP